MIQYGKNQYNQEVIEVYTHEEDKYPIRLTRKKAKVMIDNIEEIGRFANGSAEGDNKRISDYN